MVNRRYSRLVSGAFVAALVVLSPSESSAQEKEAASVESEKTSEDKKQPAEDGDTSDAAAPVEKADTTAPGDKSDATVTEETPDAASATEQTEDAPPSLEGVAVFVLPKNPASSDGAGLLQDMMRNQLEGFANIEIRSRAMEPRSIASGVAKELENGFRALNDGEEDVAKKVFAAVLKQLKAHTGPLNKRLMAQTLKGLGVAHAMDGDTKDAKRFINASLNFWPEQKTLEYAYSKDVFQVFSAIEKARVTTLRASLEVTSPTEGATIFIDGEKQGASPANVKGLQAGGHWVEIRAEGHETSAKWVDLVAGQPTKLEMKLTLAPDSEETSQLVAKFASARSKKAAADIAEALKNAIGTEKALVIRAQSRRKGFELKGWAITDEGVVRVRSKVGANLMVELNDIVGSSLGLTPKAGTGDDAEISLGAPRKMSLIAAKTGDGGEELGPQFDEQEFYETWWFWTAAGGVVLTGIVLGIVLSAEPELPKGSLNLTLTRVPPQ